MWGNEATSTFVTRRPSSPHKIPCLQIRGTTFSTLILIMTINAGNVFSAQNLSELMYQSLPKEASPHLKNPYDAIALLSHGGMLAVGFRLVGLGEDHRIGTPLYTPSAPLDKTDNTFYKSFIRIPRPTTSPSAVEFVKVRRLRLPLRPQSISPSIPPQNQPSRLQISSQLPGRRRRQSTHL